MNGTGGACCCQPDNTLDAAVSTIRLTTATVHRVDTGSIQKPLLNRHCRSVAFSHRSLNSRHSHTVSRIRPSSIRNGMGSWITLSPARLLHPGGSCTDIGDYFLEQTSESRFFTRTR